MAKFELFKKLSVKTVCGKPKAPESNEPKYLMEVFGVAMGVKRGESNFGPWYAFTGTFQAVNMETGKVARSGVLFLPSIAGDLLLPAVSSEKNQGVEFAFRIGVKRDESSTIGYTYIAEPLMPVSENDPIELLSRKMQALPSPENVKDHPTKKAANK